MDCHDCDFAYFRRNLPYVDFVRDPKLSDVHLLVTEQRTATNGRYYGFNFLGSGAYSDISYKLDAVSPQSDTDLQTWNADNNNPHGTHAIFVKNYGIQ